MYLSGIFKLGLALRHPMDPHSWILEVGLSWLWMVIWSFPLSTGDRMLVCRCSVFVALAPGYEWVGLVTTQEECYKHFCLWPLFISIG